MPNLFPVVAPLVVLIALGYIVGRAHKIDLKSIGIILIFVVTPIVAFGSTAQLSFRREYLLLPILSFIVASLTGLASKFMGSVFLRQKDLGAFLPEATGTCNSIYLGIPIVTALFQPEMVGVYFLIILGLNVFENTVGYYFVAKENISMREALLKVCRLPTLYATVAGFVFSAYHIGLDPIFLKIWDASKGAIIFFGMMLVGLALSSHKKLEIHKDLLALTILGRYGFWNVLVLLFIWSDHAFLHMFSVDVHKLFLLLGTLPVAANLSAIAAQCDFKPQAAAPLIITTVILSFALLPFVLPFIVSFQI